jgi:hypothetical protein
MKKKVRESAPAVLPGWLEQEIARYDRAHVLAALRNAYFRRLDERLYTVTKDMPLDELKTLSELL